MKYKQHSSKAVAHESAERGSFEAGLRSGALVLPVAVGMFADRRTHVVPNVPRALVEPPMGDAREVEQVQTVLDLVSLDDYT